MNASIVVAKTIKTLLKHTLYLRNTSATIRVTMHTFEGTHTNKRLKDSIIEIPEQIYNVYLQGKTDFLNQHYDTNETA